MTWPLVGALAAAPLSCSPSVAQPPSTVIGWAVGPEHLESQPLPGGRYLLVLGEDPSTDREDPAERKCFHMTSFLPAPAPGTRIFALLGGRVHSLATPNSEPVPLTGGSSSLVVTRLLAFARSPTPPALLVAARPPGAQGEQIWVLALGDGTINAAQEVTDKRAFASQEAFFKQYDAPRCKPGGKECLALSSDGQASFLDVEPVRGNAPKQLRKLPKVGIDASWASSEGKRIYVLVPCPPSG